MEKAWIISVNMGYGHQRTAYPLKDIACAGRILNANDYAGIPERDRAVWEQSRAFYEAISKFKRIPVVGNVAFSFYDNYFQKIIDFYPKREIPGATFLTRRTYGLIKKGWGRDLIDRLKENPLPIVTTFFTAAFMAEEFDYPGKIYLIVCDADVGRQWVAPDPSASRINYCAPNVRVFERLKLYGVPKRKIFLTGYPLPQNCISKSYGIDFWKMDILKKDLAARLANLDPKGAYFSKYCDLIGRNLCKLPKNSLRPLTILFSAGGAGAQSEIGVSIVSQLKEKIKKGKIKVILSVGINENLKNFYQDYLNKTNLSQCPNIEILFQNNIADYFERFNKTLRITDILWTKPSELSFYSALGLPIIIAPPIGSQEDFNKSWLQKSGFGIAQEGLNCIDQWLTDWLNQGYLAEAAMEGFIEGEKLGTYHIKRLVFNKGRQN